MHGALSFIRKHLILTVFFSLLGVCLFFGDGQQMLIDTVGTAGVLIVVLVAHLYGKKERELPVIPALIWGGLILYYCIRTAWSDDIGYSVYTTVRLIDAFLVFSLFYCYTTDDDRKIFPAYILGFSLFALVASVFFTLIPVLRDFLPKSNLLVPNYGHNHIVDILLFGIPIAFFQAVYSKKSLGLFISISLLFGVLFSFARAAMVLVGMFLLIAILVSWKKISSGKKIAIGTVVVAIGILFSLFFIVPKPVYQPYLHTTVIPKMEKQPIGSEGRLEYFRQAIEAFKERPLFGSGPGTFILSSKRLQKAPDSYSRYAHNVVLEELSNGGIIGVCFYLSLILWCFLRLYTIFRSSRGEERVRVRIVSFAIILSFMYALLDFTMSFFVVLVLFWATVGATLSYETKKLKTQPFISKYVNYTAVFMVAVFYGLQLFCLSSPGPQKGILAYVYFLGETQSTDYLKNSSSDVTEDTREIIGRYHSKNSLVLIKMSEQYATPAFSKQGKKVFDQAFLSDPKNVELYKIYLRFTVLHLSKQDVAFVLKGPTVNFSEPIKKQIMDIDFSSDTVTREYLPELFDTLKEESSFPMYFAKLYYIIGANVIENDPDVTKKLWRIARDIYPDMGLLYHESASLELYVFHDQESASRILNECKSIPQAELHCKQLGPTYEALPPPTEIYKDIILYKKF